MTRGFHAANRTVLKIGGDEARAFLQGRDFALPEDVAALAPDALAHRMVLTWRAVADGRKPRDVVADILAAVEPL